MKTIFTLHLLSYFLIFFFSENGSELESSRLPKWVKLFQWDHQRGWFCGCDSTEFYVMDKIIFGSWILSAFSLLFFLRHQKFAMTTWSALSQIERRLRGKFSCKGGWNLRVEKCSSRERNPLESLSHREALYNIWETEKLPFPGVMNPHRGSQQYWLSF